MRTWPKIQASIATWILALWLALFSVAVTGCGQDAPAVSTPADRARFIGTWNVVTGTLAVVCSNHMDQTLPVTDDTIFVMGTASDLQNMGQVCPLQYNVLGHTATALPYQTCSNPMLQPTVHVTDATFVTTDGVTATHHGSGRLSAFTDLSQGGPVSCTWTEDGTYRRATP